jgi:putative thioredoxin
VRLAHNPKDIDAHYALGGWAVARAAYAEALEHFLHAAELDPQWEGEAARRAMLAVFQILGVRDPLSDAYRDKLRRLYY